MKVQNENQHYLPKYRLKKFAGKDGNFFVYNKETGKIIHVGANVKGIAAENNLYEYPELKKWNECYRGKIEKGLLSNVIENSDAKKLNEILNEIDKTTYLNSENRISEESAHWLGEYALRMLFRLPSYIDEIKKLFDTEEAFCNFMKFIQTGNHPKLSDNEWNYYKVKIGYYSSGTVIYKANNSAILLPDIGLVLGTGCLNNTGTEYSLSNHMVITILSPKIYCVTSCGSNSSLQKENRLIRNAKEKDVMRLNAASYASAKKHVISKYELTQNIIKAIIKSADDINIVGRERKLL